MGTTTCLEEAIAHTHDGLVQRLEAARAVKSRPEQSRRGCPPIDLFLSETSRHLHAVDEVLLPPARSRCRDGRSLVHDYLGTLHELEVALAHAKAHEYGSTWETRYDWSGVWDDVDAGLAHHRRQEEQVGLGLTHTLDDEELAELTGRLGVAEEHAPTRPHPYLPHTGAAGRASRRLMRMVDGFWDSVESRYVPEHQAPPHKRPGLLGQYLLADPWFEEEESPGEPAERRTPSE